MELSQVRELAENTKIGNDMQKNQDVLNSRVIPSSNESVNAQQQVSNNYSNCISIIYFIIHHIKFVITFRFTTKIGTARFEKYVHKQLMYYSLSCFSPFLRISKSEWKYTISRVCEGKMGTPEVK